MPSEFSKGISEYMEGLRKAASEVDPNQVASAMEAIMDAYRSGSTIYIFGNGGSAATASHAVCDFNKGISSGLEKKFRMVCLNDNVATLMAISNDVGYGDAFLLQLEGRLEPGDLAFGISGSGNSVNVVKAAEYAKSRGNKVISLTGYDGGKLRGMSDFPIHVAVDDMQKAEDLHMAILHAMAQTIAKHLGNPLC